jgi:DNA-binding PucR family transcriptional regulator
LLADEPTLREAVDRELGPLRDAPRNGPALVHTLRTWLDERQNLQATARRLRVAPRTVAYRLARIERLTGRRLDGPAVRRIATALLADELVGRS